MFRIYMVCSKKIDVIKQVHQYFIWWPVPDVENLVMLQRFLKTFVNDPESRPRLQEALIFNISLENGTKINPSIETNANVSIAKRMLQCLKFKFFSTCGPATKKSSLDADF